MHYSLARPHCWPVHMTIFTLAVCILSSHCRVADGRAHALYWAGIYGLMVFSAACSDIQVTGCWLPCFNAAYYGMYWRAVEHVWLALCQFSYNVHKLQIQLIYWYITLAIAIMYSMCTGELIQQTTGRVLSRQLLWCRIIMHWQLVDNWAIWRLEKLHRTHLHSDLYLTSIINMCFQIICTTTHLLVWHRISTAVSTIMTLYSAIVVARTSLKPLVQ